MNDMDVDVLEALAQADEISRSFDSTSRAGPTTTLPQWSGACVGDDTSKIGDHVLRIVALQIAGNAGELRVWVKQMAIHHRAMGAHIGVFTETRIHGVDRHTQVVNFFWNTVSLPSATTRPTYDCPIPLRLGTTMSWDPALQV